MTIGYSICLIAAVGLLVAYLLMVKNKEFWLTMLYISIAVVNLGYLMMSLANTVGFAVFANDVAYLGSVFLSMFMFLTIVRLCGFEIKKAHVITCASLGAVMFAIIVSSPMLPLYYKSVNIEMIDGATKLVKEYTEKQWQRDCKDLPASTIQRLPFRFRFDNNYFNDRYQGIPIGGYTQIVEKMLADEKIDVLLETDYFDFVKSTDITFGKTVYTGQVDAFFDYKLGRLNWRTVYFENEVHDTDNYQGNAVVNYTSHDRPWTRIIEHKFFEIESYADTAKTVISKEFSTEWKEGMDPYYPVNDEKNTALYAEYKALADAEENVIFGGRLGLYKYYDMDDCIMAALDAVKTEFGE